MGGSPYIAATLRLDGALIRVGFTFQTQGAGYVAPPALAMAGMTSRMTPAGGGVLQWDLARALHVLPQPYPLELSSHAGRAAGLLRGVLPKRPRVRKIHLAGAARGVAVTMACATRRTLS
jgi:hypothetical protein